MRQMGRIGLIIALVVVLCLGGCAMADFTPYSGAQQNWPVSPGAFVERKYDVPVYRSNPDRPYKVLGYISARTAPVRRHAIVAFMARRARELGGDALILTGSGSTYAGSIQTTSVNVFATGNTATATGLSTTAPLYGGKGDGIVIKFR